MMKISVFNVIFSSVVEKFQTTHVMIVMSAGQSHHTFLVAEGVDMTQQIFGLFMLLGRAVLLDIKVFYGAVSNHSA
jgi:hypothetical protein